MEIINKTTLEEWLKNANAENNMFNYLTKVVKLSPEKATDMETRFHDAVENPEKYTTLPPEYNWQKDNLSLAILYIAEDILLLQENTQAKLHKLREEDWMILSS